VNPQMSDTYSHERAAEQMPWYVNGTLEASEAQALATHLEQCAPCRLDHQGQVRLFDAVRADGSLAFTAESSFRKLMTRIGDDADSRTLLGHPTPSPVIPVAPARPRLRSGTVQWLAAAGVLGAVCLGYGGWTLHTRGGAVAPYVTLTSADPSYRDSPRIRIVFRAGLSVEALGKLLQGADAHIIDGPSAANVYTLGFTGSDVTAVIAEQRATALRSNPDVLFAEPLTGESSASR
jgi:hypothetical protein